MTTDRYPIVVAGAGPVGLALALGLLRQGFAVLVFERRTRLATDPRATTIQPPVLEALADLGVLGAVDARGRRVTSLQYWDWGSERELLANVPLNAMRDVSAYPWRLHCTQPDLCAVLHEAVERELPGTVQLGSRVSGFIDRGDYVEVQVEGGGRPRTVRASWLCGADGAQSAVRKRLDTPVRQLAGVDTFLTCEVATPMHQLRGVEIGDAAFLFTALGPALFMRMADCVRVLMLVDPEEGTASTRDPEAVARIVFGADSGVELRNRAVYTVQQQVATTWRQGRVLLLGDAAHATLPVSGTAMNTGILDGFLLAQALPHEARVEQWERERRTELEGRVDANALAAHRFLAADGWIARKNRRDYLTALGRNPTAARAHALRASLLEDRT